MAGARAGKLRKAARFQLRRLYLRARRTLTSVLIERRLGIETSGYADLEPLGVAGPGRRRYEPSKWLDLRRALRPGEVGPEDVFLDVGSGKGRVVLQAASYPFRRVIGVELSPALCAVASANVAARRGALRCTDIELVTADVATYAIPDDVTVVYHYNSIGEDAFAELLQRLLESLQRRPRELRFIYNTALEEEALLGTGRFELIRTVPGLRPSRAWSRKLAVRVYRTVGTPD